MFLNIRDYKKAISRGSIVRLKCAIRTTDNETNKRLIWGLFQFIKSSKEYKYSGYDPFEKIKLPNEKNIICNSIRKLKKQVSSYG